MLSKEKGRSPEHVRVTGLLCSTREMLDEPASAAMAGVLVLPLTCVVNRRRIGADRRVTAAACLPRSAAARTVTAGIGLSRALLSGSLRLRTLRVLRGGLIRLRKRSDRGAKNNGNSNSFDERFHETTSRECLIRAADVTDRAVGGSSVEVDQTRINPPFLNSVLLLTRQSRKPAHQGFAGVRGSRRGSSEQKFPAHSINAGDTKLRAQISIPLKRQRCPRSSPPSR